MESEYGKYENHYGQYNGSDYGSGYMYGYEYYDFMTYGFPEDIASSSIKRYLPPFLLIIGTTGNVLSALVLLRLTSRVLTTCFYLTLIAIVDTLLLYIRCGNVWIREVLEVDITNKIMTRSNASCQVYNFISNFILHLCAWLLVAAVVECAVITVKPLKAHKICNLDRAKNVLLIQVLLLVCVNAHFFWTYSLEQDYSDPDIYYCTFSTFGSHYSEYFRNIVWPIMDLLSSSVMPGSIIFVAIIYTLRRICCLKRVSILENTLLLNAYGTYQLITVTLILGIASLVFTAPETGYNLFEYILERGDLLSKLGSSMKFDARRRLAQATCILSRDIFLTCKFFFYCISWQSFRIELVNMFRRVRKMKNILPSKSKKSRRDYEVDTDMSCLSKDNQC